MQKKKMMVEWDDGAELSRSRKRPGHYSPLTRDGGNNLGHVTLTDVDDEGSGATPGAQVAGIVAVALAATAKPHVERWWNDQALPAIKATTASVRRRFVQKRTAGQENSDVTAVTFVDVAPADASAQVAVAAAGQGRRMSRQEGRQRLLAALAAREFSDEQLRVLRSAQFDDTDALPVEGAREELTPSELADRLTLMLEANPALLDDLVEVFLGARAGDGGSLPPGSAASTEEDSGGQ